MVECMNNVLKTARLLPIKACIEHTFYKMVDHFRFHREIALKCNTELPPQMWSLFSDNDTHAQEHTVTEFDRQMGVYQVVSRVSTNATGGNNYRVDYNEEICTCGKWQAQRFPCSHAIAACRYRGEDVHVTVSHFYTTRTNRRQYASAFHPLLHKHEWVDPGWKVRADVSKITTKRGRRRERRIHNEMDVIHPDERRPWKCSVCKQPGHNRTSCPNKEHA